MSSNQKKMLARIIVAFIFFIAALLAPLAYPWNFLFFLVPYLIIGWDILWRALRNIIRGSFFDENFLMSIATVGALILGEYPEAVAVMLFFQVGELFQNYAVEKSRASIGALMDICPDHANVLRDGLIAEVDPEEVGIGDYIVVKPGEKIPLDGVVREGKGVLDLSALTGESYPRDVIPGDEVVSGSLNTNGLITVEVKAEYEDSTVAKILDLVENAASKKAKAENFITKFARWYTPLVVIAAVILAVLPPLLFGGAWGTWIERALIFLVISCPCALVISIPLSFFGGIGGGSRQGILIKGGNYLEALSQADTFVFDKTGTLTKGVFQVTAVHTEVVSEEELLYLAAAVESCSNHPIAVSLCNAWGGSIDGTKVEKVQEIPGKGLKGEIDGREIYVGNAGLMSIAGAAYRDCSHTGTIVHVAQDHQYLGHIVIADIVKEESKDALKKLKDLGAKHLVMLTGDRELVGRKTAADLGIDEVKAEMLPGDKVAYVEELLKQRQGKGKLVFVGDGINDAPVLACADIGVAMGALGSDAAIEAADIVLMDDNPAKLAVAVKIARKTMVIVKENIVFALSVKGLVLVLGALGWANMWEAVFADVGVAVIAILNAMRALGFDKK